MTGPRTTPLQARPAPGLEVDLPRAGLDLEGAHSQGSGLPRADPLGGQNERSMPDAHAQEGEGEPHRRTRRDDPTWVHAGEGEGQEVDVSGAN